VDPQAWRSWHVAVFELGGDGSRQPATVAWAVALHPSFESQRSRLKMGPAGEPLTPSSDAPAAVPGTPKPSESSTRSGDPVWPIPIGSSLSGGPVESPRHRPTSACLDLHTPPPERRPVRQCTHGIGERPLCTLISRWMRSTFFHGVLPNRGHPEWDGRFSTWITRGFPSTGKIATIWRRPLQQPHPWAGTWVCLIWNPSDARSNSDRRHSRQTPVW